MEKKLEILEHFLTNGSGLFLAWKRKGTPFDDFSIRWEGLGETNMAADRSATSIKMMVEKKKTFFSILCGILIFQEKFGPHARTF